MTRLSYSILLLFLGLPQFMLAETMTPGTWIKVSKAKETHGLKRYGDVYGSSDHGAWLSFGPLNLDNGLVDRVEVQLAAQSTLGKLEFRLDSLDGSLVGEVQIRHTGGYSSMGYQQGYSEQLAGQHKIFLVLKGGKNLCNIKAFRFLKPGQKAAPGSLGPNVTPKSEKGLSLEKLLENNQENIKKHRTHSLKVLATPGATIEIKQIRHHFEFGTAINKNGFITNKNVTAEDQERYKKIILGNFNSVVHENAMKWYSNERKQGVQNFKNADIMLDWADQNGLLTRGHCVYWGRDNLVPKWQKGISDDELREKLEERAKIYMTRFSSLKEHDINNEMVHCTYYKKRLGPNIWKQMFDWCHEFDENALLYVNDYSILSGGDTGKYVKQIEGFLKSGMNVGGIGVQGHFGGGKINPTSIKKKLDQLGQFNLPIKITEFDVNSQDEKRKAESIATLYITAFAHPSVEGIYMWGFWKKLHWRPNAALWNADWTPTPSVDVYRQLVFKEWWTDEKIEANNKGEGALRPYFGQHKVTINGKSKPIAISPDTGVTVLDCRSSNPDEWVLR